MSAKSEKKMTLHNNIIWHLSKDLQAERMRSGAMLLLICTILSVSKVAANTSNKTNFDIDHNETVANKVNENAFPRLRIFDCIKSKVLGIYSPQTISSCDNLNNEATEVRLTEYGH